MARSRPHPRDNSVKSVISNADSQIYDVEKIYSPSLLQPHGCILIFDPQDGMILQVSANVGEYFGLKGKASKNLAAEGLASEKLLGQSLSDYLLPHHWQHLQQTLLNRSSWLNSKLLEIVVGQQTRYFEAMGHLVQSDSQHPIAIIELTPLEAIPQQSEPTPDRFGLIRQAIANLQTAPDLPSFLQQSAQALQTLTGCDRAMVYQFDAKGAGQVVAEVKHSDQPPEQPMSFLGRWFPSGDIPDPVREFYLQGGLRYVPDLNAAPIQLLPPVNPRTQAPIDLSRAILRGVDSCCVEYHQGMGVAGFLILPIVQTQGSSAHLWGLMACHHFQPKFLSGEVRAACELLSQFVASDIGKQLNQTALQDVIALKSWQTQVIESIAQAEDLKTGLLPPHPNFLNLVNASGGAICFGDEITLVGQTPPVTWVRQLLDWAAQHVAEDLFQTDSWLRSMSDRPAASAPEWQAIASGILILQISAPQRQTLMWFRPEFLQTISWVGNPPDSQSASPESLPQTSSRGPRESFAQWQETVRATAIPWQPIELENALALRKAIVGIVLQKADELAQLNLELKRSNQELEAFAYAASHDLKEPLRGIYNSIIFLLEDYESVLDEAGIERLQNLMRLSHRMEDLIDVLLQFSRLGQLALKMEPTDLNPLVLQELIVVRDSQTVRPEVRIPRPLPTIVCDPVLTREVFRNLLSNAFKYNDKPEAWVEIGYLEAGAADIPSELAAQPPPTHAYVFFIRDNGIGIRDRHLDSVFRLFKRLHPQHLYGGGTGAGLTIVKKIIERQGGTIMVQSTQGKGSTFYFTVGAPVS
jgi:two-component system, chemotaxis family, sensor kinase Cph1